MTLLETQHYFTTSNNSMTVNNELDKLRKEGVFTLFEVLSLNFVGRTEEIHGNIGQNIRSEGRDSNLTLSEYRSEAFTTSANFISNENVPLQKRTSVWYETGPQIHDLALISISFSV
jgi:hypothetical protein